MLEITRIYNIFYVLLLEKFKEKVRKDTNILKYKNKTNNKNKVKSKIYYKIRYRKP